MSRLWLGVPLSTQEIRRRILLCPCGRCWAGYDGDSRPCPGTMRGWHPERRERAVRRGLIPSLA